VIRHCGWVLHTLLSHWRRHPLQAACLLVGLWLATGLWTGVQALNSQARDSYDRAADLFSGGAQTVLLAPGGQPFVQAHFVTLRRAGWPVSPMLRGTVMLAGTHEGRRLQLTGIEPLTLPVGGGVESEIADQDSLRAFMLAPGVTWIAQDTLAEFGLESGATPTLVGGAQLPPLQVVQGLPPGMLLVDISHAQQLLDQPDMLTQLLVEPAFAAHLPAVPANVPLVWEERGEADLVRLTDSFHLNLTALGLLAFVVGLFIVHAAAGLAMEQRRGLMQTLRACGVSLKTLLGVLLLELLVLALIGGSLGVLSGFALAALLIGDVAASLRGLYGAQVGAQLALDASWWLTGMGMSLFGTLIAGGSSVLAAMRLPVLDWSRPQAWREAQGRLIRLQASLGLLLLALAGAMVVWGDSLLSGFGLLASLLLGAALLLPLCLQTLLGFAQMRPAGPVRQWFWADSQQQVSGLGIALMALLLALSANIGVGSMTEGFRQTFTGWLDQRLAADIYVRPQDDAQAVAIERWLEQRSEVIAQLPSWQLDTRVGGWPSQLSGVVEHPLYAQTWPLLESTSDPWPALAAGEGALVSEQLAFRLNLALGDTLELDTPNGLWSLEILGRYADYGNPKGQILVSAAGLQHRWPDQPVSSIGILASAQSVPQLASALRDTFDLGDSRVIDQAALKAYSQNIFEQTFAATAALNTLTLGVAAVALFTSLLGLADSRLSQLAPLWAMGLRPGQLAALSLAQMLMLAALTCALAIPLGLALAWCLVEVVNVQAFGWRLPWHWFPGQWLTLVLLALLAVLLASIGPAWRIMRTGPTRLLRSFTHDV
jgi:putative ABC transport system permease protein